MTDLEAINTAVTIAQSAISEAGTAADQARARATSAADNFAALGLDGIYTALTTVSEKLENVAAQHNMAASAGETAQNALARITDGTQVSVTLELLNDAIDKISDAATALQAGNDSADEAFTQAQSIEQEGTISHAQAAVVATSQALSAVNTAADKTNEYRQQVQQQAAGSFSSSTTSRPALGTRPVSTLNTHGTTHGTVQRQAGATTGPVIFSAPSKGATTTETKQAQEYIDAANKANKDETLSPTGRVSPNMSLEREKLAAAKKERIRAEKAGKPYGKDVAAHLPDTTWVGQGNPPGGWGRHTKRVNSALGAQSAKYPSGYQPTTFHIDDSWPE